MTAAAGYRVIPKWTRKSTKYPKSDLREYHTHWNEYPTNEFVNNLSYSTTAHINQQEEWENTDYLPYLGGASKTRQALMKDVEKD
jgi:hypothetical protein